MATKFPIDYDDAVTLGGPFIDTVAPADPQRNIAAEFRNNMNDAMIAVQNRVGFLEDPDPTTIDWGLMTIGGNANQGMRFAGDHAEWPGDAAEQGLFIDTASGHLAFHKAGDAKAVFTDLVATAGSWDAIYGVDKDLHINDTPLQFIQTSTTGHGFEILRNLAAANTDSAILLVANQNSLDDQPTTSIWGLATGAISKSVASVVATSAGLNAASWLHGVSSSVVTNAGDAADSYLTSYKASADVTAGGAASTVGFYAADSLDYGALINAPFHLDVDAEAFSTFAFPIGMLITDLSVGPVSIPFAIMDGPLAALVVRFAVWRNGRVDLSADNDSTAFEIQQHNASGSIFHFQDRSVGAEDRFILSCAGELQHRVTDFIADIDAYDMDVRSAGVGNDTIRGIKLKIEGHAGDVDAAVRGVDLQFDAIGTYDDARAVYIHGGWDYGVYSSGAIYAAAPISAEASTATAALRVAQGSTGTLATFRRGDFSVGSDVWDLSTLGACVHRPSNLSTATGFTAYDVEVWSPGLSGGNVLRGAHIQTYAHVDDNSMNIYGIELETNVTAGVRTTHGIHIDQHWNRSLYAESTAEIDMVFSSDPNLVLTRTGTGNFIEVDSHLVGSWKLNAHYRVNQDVALGSGTTGGNDFGYGMHAQSWTTGAGERTYGFKIANTLNVASHAESTHYGIYLDDCWNSGSGQATAIHVGRLYDVGITSESPTILSLSPMRVGDVLTLQGSEQEGTDVAEDGDMEAVGVTSWIASSTDVTLTKDAVVFQAGTQSLRLTMSAATEQFAQQSYGFPHATAFRVRGWAKTSDQNAWIPKVRFGNVEQWVWAADPGNDWQQFEFDVVNGQPLLELIADPVGGDLGEFINFDEVEVLVLDSVDLWVMDQVGTITHTPIIDIPAMAVRCTPTDADPTSIVGMSVDMYRTAPLTHDMKNVYGIKSTSYGDVGDVAAIPAVHAAFRAEFSGSLSSGLIDVWQHGFSCGDGFTVGMYSESPVVITGDPAIPLTLLNVFYEGTGNNSLISAGVGSFTGGDWRFIVTNDGTANVRCYATSGSALNIESFSTLGSELLEDGDMEKVGVADWTAGNNAILSKTTAPDPVKEGTQSLKVEEGVPNGGSATDPYASQTVLTVGCLYRITGWMHGEGNNDYPVLFNGDVELHVGQPDADWQWCDVVIMAAHTDLLFIKKSNGDGVGAAAWFDEWTVKEVEAADICRMVDREIDEDRFLVRPRGQITMRSADGLGESLLEIHQQHTTQPFIYFHGEAAADTSLNISTGDSGNFESANRWIAVDIGDGTKYWIQLYTAR